MIHYYTFRKDIWCIYDLLLGSRFTSYYITSLTVIIPYKVMNCYRIALYGIITGFMFARFSQTSGKGWS